MKENKTSKARTCFISVEAKSNFKSKLSVGSFVLRAKLGRLLAETIVSAHREWVSLLSRCWCVIRIIWSELFLGDNVSLFFCDEIVLLKRILGAVCFRTNLFVWCYSGKTLEYHKDLKCKWLWLGSLGCYSSLITKSWLDLSLVKSLNSEVHFRLWNTKYMATLSPHPPGPKYLVALG